MSFTVNTNVYSMNAQRNLMATSDGLKTAMQRLSSGLKINSAADDAAGLQISNRLNSQAKGLTVAISNANNGISLAQTAEGALQETTNILQRIRELSLQSANGSNSNADRAALQKEVTALQSEMTRISETTTFGGQVLLDGTYGTQQFQIGANAGETLDIVMSAAGSSDLGKRGMAVFDTTGIADTETVAFGYDSDGAGAAANEEFSVAYVAASDTIDTLADKIRTALAASTNATGLQVITEGNNIVVTGDVAAGVMAAHTTASTGVASEAFTAEDVSKVDISTASGAQQAVAIVDAAIADVDDQRADLGAVQNRLSTTISNLSNIRENVSASRSRIMDADFAVETANLAKYQVMQQAGTAMLSQANAQTQSVLSLLQ
ncbi:flagellin [Kistimonas asteriae]|uniref:flagellin N-terminal helical domain-containing protein n=1 Tax=Kistimonas asteriae TaxID=517724 RepID=UPI001BAB7152|nr:flagellin [Kistimonas asteriae]